MTRQRIIDAIETALLWCAFEIASLVWPADEVDG